MSDHAENELALIPTVDYRQGKVRIIDQTLLPAEEKIIQLESVDEVADAIRTLKVRGAPAIGITAAYGVLLSVENLLRSKTCRPTEPGFDRGHVPEVIMCSGIEVLEIMDRIERAAAVLAGTRPTAANLFWALERMKEAALGAGDDADELCRAVAGEAFRIHEEALEVELTIGRNGARFIEDGMRILTHCNAGGLATAGYGTALGVIYRADEEGKRVEVYVDETRPLLQGARLTAWELLRRGIDVTVLCDGAAASLFSSGVVDAVITGADRIAANGDAANKIGTLGLAVLCEKYGKPFYVAAPWSTFDTSISSGREIPIEERPPEEVTHFSGTVTVANGARIYNPAFDVTPAGLITAIITERGAIEGPDRKSILELDITR